ncbi:MAG: UpxY family transcription antiterminator [Deltaproteobacteria bacterium]|nr:UpxY family transcription antiterminator [Deltaproteobacteria bacterium]
MLRNVQEGNPLSLQAQPENFLPWYIIHTCSRHEAKVEAGLTMKGQEVFLPRVMVRSRRQDRLRMLEVPLFPGYLFVHTDLSYSDYYHIIRQDGVVRILGIKGQCTPVPEETVASIRTLVNSGQPIFTWSKLAPGKRVRVVDGPLAGASGVISRLKKGNRRLVVGVELLGRSICAELAEESVEVDE